MQCGRGVRVLLCIQCVFVCVGAGILVVFLGVRNLVLITRNAPCFKVGLCCECRLPQFGFVGYGSLLSNIQYSVSSFVFVFLVQQRSC